MCSACSVKDLDLRYSLSSVDCSVSKWLPQQATLKLFVHQETKSMTLFGRHRWPVAQICGKKTFIFDFMETKADVWQATHKPTTTLNTFLLTFSANQNFCVLTAFKTNQSDGSEGSDHSHSLQAHPPTCDQSPPQSAVIIRSLQVSALRRAGWRRTLAH